MPRHAPWDVLGHTTCDPPAIRPVSRAGSLEERAAGSQIHRIEIRLWRGGPACHRPLVDRPHDFRADEGDSDYGDELDAEINWRLDSHWSLGLKYADYQAKQFAVDTRKAWLWVEASF